MTTTEELLGPDGPLAGAMAGYEHRQGQLDMARAVELAIDEDRILLCEAGTGTGKTLAYLVPALLSRRKVVVSTASKALQEQIVGKDLPLIQEHLGLSVDAVLVKGLANYLCRRRLRELQDRLAPALWDGAVLGAEDEQLRQALPAVEAWAERTMSGDIAEATELSEGHPIWREVCSSSDTRIGPSCPSFEGCHVTQLRRRAEQADLLVVNHHLFFADLAIKGNHPGGVLPPYDVVILDEAHRIENIATGFFGTQVSSTLIDRLLRDAERVFLTNGLHADPRRPPPIIAQCASLARDLFGQLRRDQATAEGRQPLAPDTWSGKLLDLYHQLDDSLAALEAVAATQGVGEPIRSIAHRVDGLRDGLSRIVEPDRAQITWCERRARSVGLAASPVDVGPLVRERLFEQGYAAVLTSASLSTDGDFAFMRSRLGLAEAGTAPIDELIVQSALDHERRALLYTPTDLPDVSDAEFLPQAIERIAALLGLTGGGAFVLCTSIRNMSAIAEALQARRDLEVMRQGEAPKSTLLDRFRASNDAVLVATMSFWEGVDVPGDALRLVVMDRIPFAVPTDPLIQARCGALEQGGQQPFKAYSLPQAAITLKQGFGRLLRTRADFGVVALLDGRIQRRGYGRALLASLPPVGVTEELAAVESFWRAHVPPTD
ncbi:MAG: ATP-dependent DNA helicase [Deltaproteobacteria bacterium]|jgi:ATP-dependent DNA helicase DinG|nr:ATP-dependent DNA helicase [Deltaproteobacteria bacterium]MBW2534906.1 ATP-dependent DNA helicase [Deltaproteobacteria bacterium]